MWMQDGAGMSTGYFLRRVFSFAADGSYALVDMLCFSDYNGTSCQEDESPEGGVALVTGNVLTLNPTTASDEGQRAYQFAVIRDPNMGDLRLQFYMPDYTDEWFWVEPT
jgi:hypothetical protein